MIRIRYGLAAFLSVSIVFVIPLDAQEAKKPPPKEEEKSAQVAPPKKTTRTKGPDVVLIASEERRIYEYRQNGRITMIRVEPKNGNTYYLVPQYPSESLGEYRQNDRLQARWVIKEF